MYEVILVFTVILILAIVVLFVYFVVAQDIFNVLGPRIDTKFKTNFNNNITPVNQKFETIDIKIDTLSSNLSTKYDSKIGDLGDSNVKDYISNYVDENTFIIKTPITATEAFTNYEPFQNGPFEYTIGDPSITDSKITLVNDVNVNGLLNTKSGLKICNDTNTCYNVNVNTEGNLVILKEGSTTENKFTLNDNKLLINDLQSVNYSDMNDTTLDKILTNKLNTEMENYPTITDLEKYPKKSEYTHVNKNDGNGWIENTNPDNGVYPTKQALSQYATTVQLDSAINNHYHKNTWDGNTYQEGVANQWSEVSETYGGHSQ